MRLTASGLARAELCIGSVVQRGFDETTKWAGIGQAVDDYVRTAKTRGVEAALKAAPEDLRHYLEALTLDRIPDGAEFQVAFAFNVVTGEVRRIPGRGEGYPTDLGDEWIFGTADIVGVRDGRAIVIDLKWGSYTIGRDPATDLQLGMYGVCAAAVAGVDEAEIGFSRAGWDGVLRPDVVVLDSMDLAAMRDRISAIWRRAKAAEEGTAPVRLHVTEECTYCPARRGCDAWEPQTALLLRGDLESLVAEEAPPQEMIHRKLQALTLEQRGRVYEIAGEIEERAKAIRAAVRGDACLEPIPLSGGKELREVQWGARKASDEAKKREAELEEQLRAAGEVKTVKVKQVRPMAARRGR